MEAAADTWYWAKRLGQPVAEIGGAGKAVPGNESARSFSFHCKTA